MSGVGELNWRFLTACCRQLLLLPALLLSGCDSGPPLPDDPYYRLTVEAIFDGEAVRIDGVVRCELSKIYRSGIGIDPPSIVAKQQPGLMGTRLKDGAPGALFIIAPRLCRYILREGQVPTPVEGYIPLLAWFENPGESHRLQLYLYDAYHPGTESRIEFKSFAIADATEAEHADWLAEYTGGADALPLDPIAAYQIKYYPGKRWVGAPGGGFSCDVGLRIPPEVWRQDPVIVDWVESQSGDGRYWAIPLPPIEQRTQEFVNPYTRVADAHHGYIRDEKGKWLGMEPMVYQTGGMLNVLGTIRYAYDKATLQRSNVPIAQDIWDFYMPLRYTADGAVLSPEAVGVVECQAGIFRSFGRLVRHTYRIEGLRDGDWEIAGAFYYDTKTDEFITVGTTGLNYDSAY